jgi:eukaryotic-like serine/threonine-protein kinase
MGVVDTPRGAALGGGPVAAAGRTRPRPPPRMVPEGAKAVHTTLELEEQLRKRLRVEAVIWALATGMIALTVTITSTDLRGDPMSFWTKPPLPGVLFLLSLATVGVVWILSPDRQLGVTRLRIIEWLGVAATAAFLVVDEALDLETMTRVIAMKPMDLGLGLGVPWGALIVAYGVLIPSNLRHALVRTLLLVGCAFLPELLTFPWIGGFIEGSTVYLAIKFITVVILGALALYGSYRIDELSADARSARQLGQYVLRESLGQGGMGSVYLADHQFLRRPCAVKLIRPELARDRSATARFEREVQSAAALTHPNTVQIYDYGQSADGTLYYAMEYLPGAPLDALVEREGPFTPRRVVHVLCQLCGALGEAHARGLVHRDVKPGNVMLCERGGRHDVVKLLDFGLVAGLRPEPIDPKISRDGMVIGTPGFMSPEQCRGDAVVTPASDIYSLGALGYFLATGKEPFRGRSSMEIMLAHLHDPPTPVRELKPDVPAVLASVIERCLAKDPFDRFSSAGSLEAALQRSTPQ